MNARHAPAPIALLATLLLGLLAAATPAAAQTSPDDPGVVVATGERVITVAPDQAWVMMSVDTRDERGPEARRLGAVAITSVRAALTATGLTVDAVQTVGFALHPEYDYTNGRQRMKGFVVSNQLQVRVDDVMKMAEVLDAVAGLALPASSTATIGNLRFDLKDRAGVERQALRQAVQDAIERATAMALGAGQALGRVVRIDEGRAPDAAMKFGEQVMMARAGDGPIATPVSPSDIEIRAQVTVTVEIK